MTTIDGAPTRVVKRRPKDRKAQIARASADAFSALGYHAVGMDDIAAAVGISAPALYRHSSSKYELFRDAVLALGQQLVDATAFAETAAAHPDPARMLDALVAVLIDTTIANRTSGGLYRWEGRYLRDDDRAALGEQVKLVNRRLQRPLLELRPTLTSRDRWTLSASALSIIGSITDHRARLSIGGIRAVLADLVRAALAAELPGTEHLSSSERVAPRPGADTGRREALLRASMRLFSERGYRETSMEDIAAAVGMPVSGIYRYFAGKGDLLAASYHRAADRISGDLAEVLAAEQDPRQAMLRLIPAYVSRSFDDPELGYVYYTDRANLPPADQAALRRIQRSTVESWVRLLVAARPELTAGRARFAVHAAFTLVVDLGRLVHYDDSAESRAYVVRMMEVILLGAPASTTG